LHGGGTWIINREGEFVDLVNVKKALTFNAHAYDAIRAVLREGITEQELFDVITGTYARYAGQPVRFLYDLLSGERSGGIAGPAANRVVKTGDCLIVDLSPCCEGSWCDTTRTFFLGPPSEVLRKVYETILGAIRQGEKLLRPGAVAGDIYARVSDCLVSMGYPKLVHHAGHAVGSKALEEPDFTENASGILRQGMVVTLEPGIYVKGQYGVRVENNYLITGDGYEPLFDYPEDIEHCIVANVRGTP
jgi:Xaa-Pro dipeptidase